MLALALGVIRRPARTKPLLPEEVITSLAVRPGGLTQAAVALLKEVRQIETLPSNAEPGEADFSSPSWGR